MAVAAIVHRVEAATRGPVKVAVYVPLAWFVAAEKLPPLSEARVTVASGIGFQSLTVDIVIFDVPPEYMVFGLAAAVTMSVGTLKRIVSKPMLQSA